MQTNRNLASILLILVGLFGVGMALFAPQIGLERAAGWGRTRILVFSIGLAIAVLSFYDMRRLESRIAKFIFVAWPNRVYTLAGACVLLVILVYVWFVSAGLWIKWPRTTTYYDQLAAAFQHGRLDLQIGVDPKLLALSNPYDPSQRGQVRTVDYIWDMSLYKGKVYLYWGPVPALILLPVKVLFSNRIGDHVLSLAFLSGLIVFQTLFMLRIWRLFFSSLPAWTIALGIVVSGLSIPIPYVLSYASIYEAAIAAGQFFFLGGLYLVFCMLASQRWTPLGLAAVGIFWSCAVGSRVFLSLPVAFMTLVVSSRIIRDSRRLHVGGPRARELAALWIPLLLSAFALVWYNWARFDSPFETGLRYQIGGADLNALYSRLFLPAYILPNLYAYLFRAFGFRKTFPFMVVLDQVNQARSWPAVYSPEVYVSYGGIGMIMGAPFASFALLAMSGLIRRMPIESEKGPMLFRWLLSSLLGSFLLPFGALLLYFNAAMKYMIDFIYCLSLLALIGFWQGWALLKKHQLLRGLYAICGIGIAGFSVLASVLLAFAINGPRFLDKNPVLFDSLTRWFAAFLK